MARDAGFAGQRLDLRPEDIGAGTADKEQVIARGIHERRSCVNLFKSTPNQRLSQAGGAGQQKARKLVAGQVV